jgi:NADH:ubiquinone oxidoreductase subunit 6 (subunit J)
MGILALVLAAQRGHRPWSIAFLVVLVLFAYSPLLLTWVLASHTPIYDASRFYVNTTALFLVLLSKYILPAIILAVDVLVYSFRYRRNEGSGMGGQD